MDDEDTVRRTDLTQVERKLLGLGALTCALFPIAFIVGMVAMWLWPSAPKWLWTIGFGVFILYAGMLVPFYFVFGYVANEILPEEERSAWARRFKGNPFGFWSFWRRYLQ